MDLFKTLSRKKPICDTSPTQLAKVLSALDLTALGIGSTLGVGVYVLAGEVSKEVAGPAVIFSFMIAAVASVFAGLCYAEFGAKVPRAGSAYVYCYVTIGEFIAFIIGWNLILEYSIGAASVVKGLSTYVNSSTGMHDIMIEWMPLRLDGLSQFPDIFAFVVTILFSLAIAFGAKESSIVNNVFTFLNLSVVLFVIIAGSFRANLSNWNIAATEVPPDNGEGGFAPYGITGIFKGAAICFYGFIGFDCIATAGEEAKNPKRSMPIAIILSLFVIFLAYFGISTVLTMMLPYYLQDKNAPLPYVFDYYGWTVAKYIVTIGATFGLCASLMGSMFPLPRIVYAMSNDGLIFEWMGRIHPRYKTPLFGTLFVGTLTGLLAAFFNLSQLVNMMSIGTLMAYSIVAACVLLLRYEVEDENEKMHLPAPFHQNVFRFLWNTDHLKIPTKLTATIVTWEVTVFCFVCILFAGIIEMFKNQLYYFDWWAWLNVAVVGLTLLLILVLISRQPTAQTYETFAVPLTPFLPGISIMINMYLMMMLDSTTWIRFLIWIGMGLLIYLTYGLRNSKERLRRQQIAFVNNKQTEVCTFSSSKEILVPTGQ
ncbi:cationic amino acid transporter 2-like [Contarinia nasturtii]|uniref:cationic amino acid transporter 2-like n=1 Tax=Contarinia nasturtii TaxID=265458 RepID=UPI0012D471F8|nr:cationic amino acid transporter 2-like [Contarinia nasturtii]XP_031625011.1 cationic amino acid transporter 2-like [Contarinia nasturtii]XP_031625018.1 cationic amino acid transporter 2-like [Contarinia nasturtii]